MTSNRALLEKADLVVANLISDGGYLPEEKAKKFLDLVLDEANLLPMCTVFAMKSHTASFPKIGFTTRVLRPGVEGAALPKDDRVKPTLEEVEITTSKVMAETAMSYESVEDNVENGRLEQKIMDALKKRVGVDIDDLILNGDTTSTDPLLALFDGFRKLSTSNTVNAAGSTLDLSVLKAIKKACPHKYLWNNTKFALLTSTNAQSDYMDLISQRATSVGDAYLTGDRDPAWHKIPIKALGMMPEDLTLTADRTDALFCDPKNMTVGVWRKMRIEMDRDIQAQQMRIVMSMRLGVNFMEEDATVHASSILAS